jgi:hypothetical protein
MVNLLPRRIRWHGELSLLERDVEKRVGAPPFEQWLAGLNRIEQAAARVHTPTSSASASYTLREYIRLVRQAVLAKVQSAGANAQGERSVGAMNS